MAVGRLYLAESDLVGTIENANLTTTGLTVDVRFIDKKTRAARSPQATTRLFTFAKDESTAETVLVDSLSTTDGITTLTINANGRNLPKFGTGLGSATGFEHPVGTEVGCVNIALPLNELVDVLVGTNATNGTDFRIGQEVNANIRVYFANGDANEPFLEYNAASNKVLISNDGINTYDPEAGGSGLSAGNGIAIAASVISAKLGAGLSFDGSGNIQLTTGNSATETTEGVVELGTLTDMQNQTVIGEAGPTVVQTQYALREHNIYIPAFLTTGTNIETTPAIWDSVTDGEFAVTIDGVAYEITGLDFNAIVDLDDVAAVVQAGIRAATGSTETFVYNGVDAFILTSADTTVSSAVTVLSTIAVPTGTDISGATAGSNYLDGDAGNGTVTNAVLNEAASENHYWISGPDGFLNEDALGRVIDTAGYSAAGDLPVGIAANTGGVLSVGTDGQVLTADSAAPEGVSWDNFPRVGAQYSGTGAKYAINLIRAEYLAITANVGSMSRTVDAQEMQMSLAPGITGSRSNSIYRRIGASNSISGTYNLSSKEVVFCFTASLDITDTSFAADDNVFVGFIDSTTPVILSTGNAGRDVVGIMARGDNGASTKTRYFHTQDNGTVTETNISAFVPNSNTADFAISITSTEANLYVNGELAATHAINMLTIGVMLFSCNEATVSDYDIFMSEVRQYQEL